MNMSPVGGGYNVLYYNSSSFSGNYMNLDNILYSVDTTINLTTLNLNGILLSNSSSNVVITLPSVGVTDVGKCIQIQKMGSGNLTINRSDSDTIEDGTSISNTSSVETWANVTLFLAQETYWKFYGAPLGTWVTA